MRAETSGRVRLSVAEARALAEGAMRGIGYEPEEPRGPMRALRETSVSVLLDGGNQNGMLGMYHATRVAIERAHAHGLALVGVTNIWMSGRSAYYVEMVARAGLIGIHTVAAPPMVAPRAGRGRPSAPIRSPSDSRWRATRS